MHQRGEHLVHRDWRVHENQIFPTEKYCPGNIVLHTVAICNYSLKSGEKRRVFVNPGNIFRVFRHMWKRQGEEATGPDDGFAVWF